MQKTIFLWFQRVLYTDVPLYNYNVSVDVTVISWQVDSHVLQSSVAEIMPRLHLVSLPLQLLRRCPSVGPSSSSSSGRRGLRYTTTGGAMRLADLTSSTVVFRGEYGAPHGAVVAMHVISFCIVVERCISIS